MTEHTRRNLLRGAALAAVGGFAAVHGVPLLGGPAGGGAARAAVAPLGKASRFPFLQGAFAPVKKEVTAFNLAVTGQIPPELNGRYLRIGPNLMGLEDPRSTTGCSGAAWCTASGYGTAGPSGTATAGSGPSRSRRSWASVAGGPVTRAWISPPTPMSSAAGRILAAVRRAGRCRTSSSDELDTIGPCDFGGTLPGGFAAHTKLDAFTGELHAIAYYLSLGPRAAPGRGSTPPGRSAGATEIPVAAAR